MDKIQRWFLFLPRSPSSCIQTYNKWDLCASLAKVLQRSRMAQRRKTNWSHKTQWGILRLFSADIWSCDGWDAMQQAQRGTLRSNKKPWSTSENRKLCSPHRRSAAAKWPTAATRGLSCCQRLCASHFRLRPLFPLIIASIIEGKHWLFVCVWWSSRGDFCNCLHLLSGHWSVWLQAIRGRACQVGSAQTSFGLFFASHFRLHSPFVLRCLLPFPHSLALKMRPKIFYFIGAPVSVLHPPLICFAEFLFFMSPSAKESFIIAWGLWHPVEKIFSFVISSHAKLTVRSAAAAVDDIPWKLCLGKCLFLFKSASGQIGGQEESLNWRYRS